MITYTVFEPDDATDLAYRWYGEAMVYVYENGAEIDAFAVETPDDVLASAELVSDAVSAYHAANKSEHPPEPPPVEEGPFG